VYQAAALTPQERRVVHERLGGGQSFGEIGRELGVTRQRAAQIEADACRKLGLAGSVALVIHDDERTERALRLRERGRRVRGELKADPEAARRRSWMRLERWEVEHEARVRAFMKSAV
jgi:DNA-binding CsgD family transcriptional regulator